MFKRWFGRKKSPEVYFRCEHDGIPERELKIGLGKLFQSRPDVKKAFLAVVTYEGEPGNGVALCITGVEPHSRQQLANEIGEVFAGLFQADQHLDLIFPVGEEEDRLAKVCRPFFVRGGNLTTIG